MTNVTGSVAVQNNHVQNQIPCCRKFVQKLIKDDDKKCGMNHRRLDSHTELRVGFPKLVNVPFLFPYKLKRRHRSQNETCNVELSNLKSDVSESTQFKVTEPAWTELLSDTSEKSCETVSVSYRSYKNALWYTIYFFRICFSIS